MVRERDEAMKEKSERFDVADKECRWPRGARKGKEMGSPQELLERDSTPLTS